VQVAHCICSRTLVLLLLLLVLIAGAAKADETAAETAAAGGELQPYVNAQQQYKLSVPAGWDRKDKAGACASSTHVLVPMHMSLWTACCTLT
jgi:hypothetical protein